MEEKVIFKATRVIALFAFVATALFSCDLLLGNVQTDNPTNPDDDGSTDSGITLTATIPGVGGSSVFGSSAMTNADEVWAVQVESNGYIGDEIFDNKIVGTITDGNLSITLPQDSHYMLLLVDSDAPAVEDVILGYIGIDDTNNLLEFPAASASGDVDLGNLTDESGEYVSEDDIETHEASFDLGLSDLRTLARTDDTLREVVNVYMNAQNTWASWAEVGVHWYAIPLDDSIGSYVSPSVWVANNYAGMDARIAVSDYPGVAIGDFEGGSLSLQVIPPGTVQNTSGSYTWSTTDPLSLDGSPNSIEYGEMSYPNGMIARSYSDGDLGVTEFSTSPGQLFVEFGNVGSLGDGLDSPLPAGVWEIQFGTDVVARYDLSVSEPIDSAGIARVLIPTINVNIDGSNTIKTIDIRWYLYADQLNDYEEIPATVVSDLIVWPGISIDSPSETDTFFLDIPESQYASVDLSAESLSLGPSGNEIHLWFNRGSVRYHFRWTN